MKSRLMAVASFISLWFTRSISLLLSAWVWFGVLLVGGSVSVSYGIALEFGFGYGLIAGGLIAIGGSLKILKGLSHDD